MRVGCFIGCFLALWTVCGSVQTHQDAKHEREYKNVINLLEALNVTRSRRGVSKAKGHDPEMPAWRFRSSTPHLTLQQDVAKYLRGTSRGVLGLQLVGRQKKNSKATLISFTSPDHLKQDGRPLLELVSNTRADRLQLEFRSAEGLRPETVKFPGGSPFVGGGWVRMALSVEPRQVVLFVECQEAVVLKLKKGGRILTLDLPHDLQVTFSSTAGHKASKFNGYWQTAELSTRAYERRPWFCDNVTDLMQEPAQPTSPPIPDVMHDQGHHEGGAELSYPGIPRDSVQRFGQLENHLHSINTMLDMLKKQNANLEARVEYLESCECVKRKCEWEGHQMDEGSRWSPDSHSVCSCTSGKVQCERMNECSFHGNIYNNGDVFSPDDCSKCTCETGRVECDVITCPPVSCDETSVHSGSCCPVCPTRCEHEDEVYENGDVFVSRSNPCLNCICSNSRVSCEPIQCPPTLCPNPYRRPGQCCPTCSACDVDGRPYNGSFSSVDGCQICTCQGGNQACVDVHQCPQTCQDGVKPPFGSCCTDCSHCSFEGQLVPDGVSIPVPRDPCKHCMCNAGNIECNTESCPSLDCNLVETIGGQCCPRCRSCFHNDAWHLHGTQWKDLNDPCVTCTCREGQVLCASESCQVSCRNPASYPGSCCPVCDDCSVNGVNIPNGERLQSGSQCEGECRCENGNIRCVPHRCPQTPCHHPVQRPGECCPRCEECRYEGEVYADSQTFVSRQDPCVTCQCLGGQVSCDPRGSSCPTAHCTYPVKRDQCCPSCHMCEYEGRVYEDGSVFRPPGDGPCLQCTCRGGDVTCHNERCPTLTCDSPIRPHPNSCCPVCRGCEWNGVQYEEGASWTHDGRSCSCVGGRVNCDCTPALAPTPVPCPEPTRQPDPCGQCQHNHRVYGNGQTWADPENPCSQCACQDGQVSCAMPECSPPACSNPYTPHGECCPHCPPDCEYDNRIYTNGDIFPNPSNPCEDCVCADGGVTCGNHECPEPNCHYPRPGQCCQNNCNGCSYAGNVYPNGMEFPHPTDRCRTCHCTNGHVHCQMNRCPAVPCVDAYFQSGECCPQCPEPPAECIVEGQSYGHMQQFYHPSDSCQSCSCINGTMNCRHTPCPPAVCSHPINQDCCRTCDGCLYKGREHANGATFEDVSDPCATCVCRDGTVKCERRHCSQHNCPFPVQGHCCPRCDGCMYAGVEYQNGQEFSDPADHCGRCMCMSGYVTCNRRQCHHPGCSHPITRPDQCCPVCDGCLYHERVFADGETFPSPTVSCEECTCSRGDVRCYPRNCPNVPCPHPVQDPCGCGVCEGCSYNGREYGNGEGFPDPNNHCQGCTCLNGTVSCTPVSCPEVPCGRPVRPPGECCPVCAGTCEHLGQAYESGSTFTPADDRCSTCTCQNGHVSCYRNSCPQQCTHPVHSADCCPVCDTCSYDGQRYENMQTFYAPSDPCRRCVCSIGSVTCSSVSCPLLRCQDPVTLPGQCCPQCRVCAEQGREYLEGQSLSLPTDPCSTCTCVDGELSCVGPQCAKLTCMHQVTDPGSCCPRCRGCIHDGVEHSEGSTWFASSGPCMSCMCVDGVTTCSEVHCLSTCLNQINVPGECCPVCADCLFEGRVYSPGETFNPSDDPCQICTCEVMPDGEQHLRCYRKQCPSLVNCPKHNILYSSSDACCPVCAQPLSNCTAILVGNEVLATDDPCFTCQCKDLTWTCIHRGCPSLSCPLSEQHTPPDSCCPVCDECVLDSDKTRVPNGWKWTDEENECITCVCNQGHVECDLQECPLLDCPDGSVRVKNPGKCCYECTDVVSVVYTIDTSTPCVYEGRLYSHNDHWEVDECTSCTCVSGDVHCQTQRCPPLTCASDETPALVPGMCCPHCIPRPATCIVFGDPHYLTFDGKMVNFQGSCTYVLAKDCEGGEFSVHVSNDDRGRKGVSWTKEVTVYVGDVVVQLFQDWVVKVDYEPVSLPFLKEPYVYLERKTNTILLNTNVGLKVLWNGRSHLEVSVPGTYKKHMCGLCGNFNNYPQDDMILRNGQITNSEATFGNSWKVHDTQVDRGNHSNGQCSDARNINPCKEAGYSARKTANARCAVLKSPVFERCHKLVPPEMFFASCVYDLCACGSKLDLCLCDVLEAYVSECREAGVVLQWRSPTLCAVGCPTDRGYVFDECGPPCPKTCFNKDIPLGVIEAHCFKPCVPGCQCPAGLVEHNAHCITPEKCPKIIHGKV
ncbi:kielin/chordin-like protein isoform X1 [Triplophysa rosa]|uniref:Kielin/chordin-like protein n=1 Tax=Triplophysa rosa TaxID=992332 RepID=A0A9W7WLR0_TRIRA|nr:kielin/chordin-like protein isoform X1 [Triplophysa rosa]XP_057203400.1 kielin/chordin-like protein isoform X1 [Triplophysa rosa]XP_057203401.1 kielin/chordin-like protein isoform X1 [Triplophysa rosa]KAI7802308.1 putative kielin/chordin-like protein [Triplophysa rosa]